jgi:hypothetical protein
MINSTDSPARGSLRIFKNWRPFSEAATLAEPNKDTDHHHMAAQPTGIVKRMISSLASQLNLQNQSSERIVVKPAATSTSNKISKLSRNDDDALASSSSSSSSSINFHVEETLGGIQIQIKQPHLISVRVKPANAESVNKTSIKIYPLKIGRTTIGTAPSNDIVIEGEGVESEHAFVENQLVSLVDDTSSSSSSSSSSEDSSVSDSTGSFTASSAPSVHMVTLFPIGRLCAVDDVIVGVPFPLHSG